MDGDIHLMAMVIHPMVGDTHTTDTLITDGAEVTGVDTTMATGMDIGMVIMVVDTIRGTLVTHPAILIMVTVILFITAQEVVVAEAVVAVQAALIYQEMGEAWLEALFPDTEHQAVQLLPAQEEPKQPWPEKVLKWRVIVNVLLVQPE